MNQEDVSVIDVSPSGRLRCRWLAALAGLVVILVVPFALVDVPPVLDYPNHLARYFILAHPDDVILSKMYQPHWAILPNLGLDLLGALALRVTDVHIGGRILLALSLLAPVFGVVIYHRVVFRRSPYWPLASGLIAYNGIFFLGFMNFLLSLGLALIGGAAWIFFGRRQYFWTRIALGAFATVLIFFSHIFGVVLFALLIGGDEIERLRKARSSGTITARQVANAAAAILAALAPAFLLYFLSPLDQTAAAPGDWHGIPKLWRILTPFMTTSHELTLLTALVILAALILARGKVAFAPGMPIIFVTLFIAFIAAPSTIKSAAFIDGRLALMMGLLLFAGVQPHWTAPAAAATSSLIAALILVRSIYVGATWIDHRRDLDDLRAAIAHVRPGSLVLVARGKPGYLTDVRPQQRALPGIYRLDGHLAALLVIERKAFWPLLFTNRAMQPLIVKPPFDRIAQPLSEPVEWDALATETPARESLLDAPYLEYWRNNFDSVLLIDPPSKIATVEGCSLAYQGGYARLYSIDHRKPD